MFFNTALAHEGEEHPEEADVVPLAELNPYILGAGAVFFAALLVLAIWQGAKKKRYGRTAVFILVILGAAVVAYSVYFVFISGALETGVVTCLDDGSCFWTAHIHSFVVIRACNEELDLPFQTGPLDISHTHSERNIFHWHDRLPYDPEKKELLDVSPFLLGSSFDSVGVPFGKGQVFGFKDGDKCSDGSEGEWKMFAGGKYSQEWRDHIWQDRDVIHFIFDSRTPEKIEEELLQNPVEFPALGRG